VDDTSASRAYNSWWQARSDAWSQLDEAAGQLTGTVPSGQPAGELIETTSGLLDALVPVEQFWAFPGPETLRRIRDLFASASYDRFASLVARVTRALVTESYRAGTGWSLADGDHEEAETGRQAPGRPARPYFEVLVVETLTAAQELAMREEVRSWRKPGDHFVYELVVVGSAEEAIIAARVNANLQACVIRHRFAAAAAHEEPSLAHFADSRIAGELAGQAPDERAQILARRLARLRPELDLYLMTEAGVEDIAGYVSHHFRRVFHTQEGSLELHLSILTGVGAGTARRSSKRCGTTATSRQGCSTRCRSRRATRSSARIGSAT
jgi:arginine decarboxylase